ncbi:hypothetical protein SARC_09230 [Sphaeroforma arctica JP610]|uniref:WW domain-containing protein n=1 Tax=Sphaeroforma arctica JP610 TaxID=667725 RepID=A0A0L0FQP4_9EUKA|nr:hypothetical protein SARC_09230 [Sphaeroforma arctica JP610]KNC78333.1 hypothetical protein SARC_09230 [Sphaeroforma arctica JP610]|eukprot:XP_014152235.1 hypothetical protein SARC_09230 [Sphaeroforma arctica JP610]
MKKVWETYEDNGKPYYYNVVSKQSVWDVPADLATAFIPATGSDPADAPPGVQQTQPQPIQRQLQQELPHGTPAGLSQSQLPGMVGGPPNMNNQISAVNGVPQKQAPAQLYMQQGQPMLYSKADPHLQAQPQTYSNTSAQPQTSQGVSGPQSNAEAIRVENDVTHIQITTKTTTEFTTATEGEDKKSVKNDKPVGKVKLTDSEWMVIITASGRKFYNNGTQSIWELPMELDLMGYDGDKIDEICKQYMRDKESRKRSSSKRTHSDQPEQDAKKPKTVGSIDPYGHVAVIPGVISDDDSSDHYDNLPEDQKEKHFKQMLEESSITAFDSFDVVKTRLMLDKRWNLVKPKEKRILFDVHVRNLNKRDRKPALQPKDHFMALLKEKKVSANTDWYKFAARYRKDHRFKNYGTDKDRVDMFQAYKLALDEEVPDVANQKHAIENSHKHTHSPSPSHNGVGGGHSHSDREEGFRQLLLDKGKVDSYTSYRDVKSRIRSDDRYDAMGSASGRERLFDELRDSIRRKDKEYLGREAIKKREKEGASQKSEMEAKTNKERSTYKQEEGQAVFTALLLHVVKNAMSWRVAKEDLRNDSRWRDCGLSADEKEALFREHTRKLDDKAAARYHNLIESYLNLKLDTPFEEVAKHIEGDPRYERFRSEDKDERKNEFERYMVQKKKMALKDFKNLLLETKQINYKTQSEILQNPGVVEHIKSILKQDKRYIDLDCFREERYTMMNEHITDMAQRGEPRPVTASVR